MVWNNLNTIGSFLVGIHFLRYWQYPKSSFKYFYLVLLILKNIQIF